MVLCLLDKCGRVLIRIFGEFFVWTNLSNAVNAVQIHDIQYFFCKDLLLYCMLGVQPQWIW
jgi:hypothetical protein